MKAIKKTSLFYALLLFATIFTPHKTHTMEPIEPKKLGWVALAGAAILGGYIAYKQFLSYIHEEPFDFAELPFDKQYHIVTLLAKKDKATSLNEAAKTINSLAQTNKELNGLINNPIFCLKIIKNLSKQFNCSDQEAAEALQTQEAKRRLKMQEELLHLPTNSKNQAKDFKNLCEQNIDMTFTYYSKHHHTLYTPLIFIIKKGYYYPARWIIKYVINKKINIINQPDSEGNTPLILCIKNTIEHNGNRHAYETRNDYLETDPMPIYFDCLDTIKYLLEYGADPELATLDGITPLQAAQQTDNQELIDLIQNAIDKKHEKQGK